MNTNTVRYSQSSVTQQNTDIMYFPLVCVLKKTIYHNFKILAGNFLAVSNQ